MIECYNCGTLTYLKKNKTKIIGQNANCVRDSNNISGQCNLAVTTVEGVGWGTVEATVTLSRVYARVEPQIGRRMSLVGN